MIKTLAEKKLHSVIKTYATYIKKFAKYVVLPTYAEIFKKNLPSTSFISYENSSSSSSVSYYNKLVSAEHSTDDDNFKSEDQKEDYCLDEDECNGNSLMLSLKENLSQVSKSSKESSGSSDQKSTLTSSKTSST